MERPGGAVIQTAERQDDDMIAHAGWTIAAGVTEKRVQI